MTLNNFSPNSIAWLALADGVVALIGTLFLIVFFTVGEPFGTLNDLCIALAGLLSGALAWQLWAERTGPAPLLSTLALGVAVVGALVVALGSALVIFHVTGFVLAGFYCELGNALIGLWLVAICVSAQPAAGWPRGLVMLGLVAGVVMVLGFLTVPAILRGLDSMDASPWFVAVSYVSWLSTFILFPIWCLWLGRVLSNS